MHACCEEPPPRHFQSNVVIHLEPNIGKDHGCRPENLNVCVKACYGRVVPGRAMHVADSARWRVLGSRSGPGGWPGEAPGCKPRDAICQLNQEHTDTEPSTCGGASHASSHSTFVGSHSVQPLNLISSRIAVFLTPTRPPLHALGVGWLQSGPCRTGLR